MTKKGKPIKRVQSLVPLKDFKQYCRTDVIDPDLSPNQFKQYTELMKDQSKPNLMDYMAKFHLRALEIVQVDHEAQDAKLEREAEKLMQLVEEVAYPYKSTEKLLEKRSKLPTPQEIIQGANYDDASLDDAPLLEQVKKHSTTNRKQEIERLLKKSDKSS